MNREWNARVPYFVRLYSTFQDSERLYFVMTYARNGDLLGFIDKLADSVSYIKIMGISFGREGSGGPGPRIYPTKIQI